MARLLLGAFDGKRAVVVVEVDEATGDVVGLDVDNGSARPVRLVDGGRVRVVGSGSRSLVTLAAGDRQRLRFNQRRGRWDGLDLSIGWG